MGEILKLISHFPRLIEEEYAQDRFHEVTKEELKAINHHSKRTSVEPDG
jgi:hypothetical protein